MYSIKATWTIVGDWNKTILPHVKISQDNVTTMSSWDTVPFQLGHPGKSAAKVSGPVRAKNINVLHRSLKTIDES